MTEKNDLQCLEPTRMVSGIYKELQINKKDKKSDTKINTRCKEERYRRKRNGYNHSKTH